MPITNRNLPIGTRLVAKYKGSQYSAIVLAEGGIGLPIDQEAPSFSKEDMRLFKSPSAAGSAVMGGIACNGWRFWSVEGEPPGENGAKAASANVAPTSAKPAAKVSSRVPRARPGAKVISRVPNQKGVEEGKIRFWCNGCMKSFIGEAGVYAPPACPEGHSATTLDAA